MAEWSNAHVSKTCVPSKGTVSSNLTLSAVNEVNKERVRFELGRGRETGRIYVFCERSVQFQKSVNSRRGCFVKNTRRNSVEENSEALETLGF